MRCTGDLGGVGSEVKAFSSVPVIPDVHRLPDPMVVPLVRGTVREPTSLLSGPSTGCRILRVQLAAAFRGSPRQDRLG